VNTTIDVMPVLLLVLFSLALSTGGAMVIFVLKRGRGQLMAGPICPLPFENVGSDFTKPRKSFVCRPPCWLAIRGRNMFAVQGALRLNNPKPCSWLEGLCAEEKLFIAPPVRGWILVLGSGIPDPNDDVDVCFRFMQALSRKVGHVQLFSASRVLQHHAWVRAERGKIVRAYAWAGKTIWQQGAATNAEKELGLRCYDYCEQEEAVTFGENNSVGTNVDKVPLLAARWSIDPGGLDHRFLEHEHGIAGKIPHLY